MRTVSLETLQMWVVTISGIVEDRDPRRFHRLVQLAKGATLLSDSSTIFHNTSLVARPGKGREGQVGGKGQSGSGRVQGEGIEGQGQVGSGREKDEGVR